MRSNYKLALIMSMLALCACTTVTQDSGFADVSQLVQERSAHRQLWQRTENPASALNPFTQKLLASTLTSEQAVQIALMNNPSLQASLAELGIAEADLVQAGRMHNPSLNYVKLSKVIDEYEHESSVLFDVMSLLTIPLRTQMERQNFEKTKLHVAIDVLTVTVDTQKAYFNTIAAEQTLSYLKKVKESAQISAQLAKKLSKAGNWSALQQTREQAYYAQVVAAEKKAKINALKEREQLTRLLGLSGKNIHYQLPDSLPSLPKQIQELTNYENIAINNRLDIQAAKHNLENKAKALCLTKATRFINVLDLGYTYKSGDNIPHQSGYEINLEIPIFDWGDAKVAKAKHIYMQSAWQLHDLVIQACSEIRQAYNTYALSFEIAQHYRDDIVPLRKKILAEDMLRYNGMLLSTFELLNDQREQFVSMNESIEALRSFWIAQIDMQTALMVKSPFAT